LRLEMSDEGPSTTTLGGENVGVRRAAAEASPGAAAANANAASNQASGSCQQRSATGALAPAPALGDEVFVELTVARTSKPA
jgi:hypothetical protein